MELLSLYRGRLSTAATISVRKNIHDLSPSLLQLTVPVPLGLAPVTTLPAALVSLTCPAVNLLLTHPLPNLQKLICLTVNVTQTPNLRYLEVKKWVSDNDVLLIPERLEFLKIEYLGQEIIRKCPHLRELYSDRVVDPSEIDIELMPKLKIFQTGGCNHGLYLRHEKLQELTWNRNFDDTWTAAVLLPSLRHLICDTGMRYSKVGDDWLRD